MIAGQGTVGREIVEDLAALGLKPDVAVVGASGGGLTAGIALAIKARVPEAKFYTAEPAGFDDTARSFKSGQRETQRAHERHDLRRADDQHAGRDHLRDQPQAGRARASPRPTRRSARAVAFAFRELKLVVEPGGAIGLAALLAGKLDVKGKVVVAVLSGGNVDAGAVPPADRRLSAAPPAQLNSAIFSSSLMAFSGPSGS